MSLYPYEMVNVSAALEALRELKRQLSAASDPLSLEECAELRAAIAEVDCALENHEVSPRVGPLLAEAKTTLASRPPLRWPVPVKTVTSRRLRSEFPSLVSSYRKPVLWSPSYCIISAGGAPIEILKQYVENQKRPT